MNITVLVDFENDSVRTALEVATRWGRSCGACGWTPPSSSSTAACGGDGRFKPTGVNPRLVEKVRGALDAAGIPNVRIVVSGGFTAAADP